MEKCNALFFMICATIASTEWVSKDPKTFEKRLERARGLLTEVPLIDGNNDLAMSIHDVVHNQLSLFPFEKNLTQSEPWIYDRYSHTDLPLMKEGLVGAQFWSAWVPCNTDKVDEVTEGVEQIDVIKRLTQKYPDDMQFAKSSEDILDAFENGKIASLIGVEGGHMIDSSLAVLRTLYETGVRYLTVTHACSTPWAEASFEGNETYDVQGLSDFGKLVVGEMNRLGMIVDLSHASYETVTDVLRITAAPIVFTHAGAQAVCNSSRNVPDDVLLKLKANGGMVMVHFFPKFLSCKETASLDDVIAHINHVRDVAGIDHVGIGSDFNGMNMVPEGLENVSKFPNLFAELMLDESWTDENLKKLAGLNFLRVFDLIEKVKESLDNIWPIENKIHF